MANMIGPSFYAGFLDIGFLPDRTRRLLADVRHLVRTGRRGINRMFLRSIPTEEFLVGDLGFFETTFLTMQRKVFEDQALMHEAYLGEGLEGIRALGAAGIIDSATMRAWEQIDAGDPARVNGGNRILLYREQHDIIDRFYVDMRDHSPPSGRVFTYLVTLAGTPAVPGAKRYSDVFPLTLIAPILGASSRRVADPTRLGQPCVLHKPLEADRSRHAPCVPTANSDKAAEARRLIKRPIGQRVERFRMLRRGGRIVLGFLTNWRLGLEETRAAPVVAGEDVTLDLRMPPTRVDAGLADASDTRIWTNPRRRPFRVSVLLPGGRVFSTDAVLAVLSSAEPGGDPRRLTVKLPATDLLGARQTLTRLAPEWQLNEADIAAWAARADAVTMASHAYSTRVFGAPAAGLVLPEVQVEHHIEQDAYVVDALFSWGA